MGTVHAPRLRSLFAYLLLHREAPQPRQHLAFLLWPDTTESQARTNLRQLVHGLRQTLPEADRFLYADAQTVQWRSDAPFRLDVAEFEQALAQVDAAEQNGNPHDLRAALEQASAVYHGDLLPSCYDDWVLPERERLRQAFTRILERLLLLLEGQGALRAAIAVAQHLLRYDPLREESYRSLMRLYAACGDRAGALRVYQTCATILERELAVEPSPLTRNVYELLLKADAQARPVLAPQPSNTNLSVSLTSFVGREMQMAEIRHRLQTTRLLTLTGTGGCGKTRLALEVATNLLDAYPNGVWRVELAALSDAALVPQAVATALGVRAQSGRALTETLSDYLGAKRLLLLLDNCEHLLDVCARLAEQWLRACPHLRILATSREPLGIDGETTWPVPSLRLPEAQPPSALEDLSNYEAIRLFVERAVSVLPTFKLSAANGPLVAQICRRLDGIPLAIELAAARVKVLTVEQIAVRLDDVFGLLTAGRRTALLRHQTLRATIDWSYDLLSDKERVLLRRLAVFAGGFTLEATESACVGEEIDADEVLELLARLVDKSLVAVSQDSSEAARYHLLETIRQYAYEKLREAGEAEVVRRQHADFLLALAEQVEPEFKGPQQRDWLERVGAEHDNVRGALGWTIEDGEAEKGLRLASALHWFWQLKGFWTEGRMWLEKLLAQLPPARRTALRAKALYVAGALAHDQGDNRIARCLLEDSAEIYRALGERRGLAYALVNLGWLNLSQGDLATAAPRIEESLALFRAVADKWGLATSLMAHGGLALRHGDYETASKSLQASLTLRREVGDKVRIASSLNSLGDIARWQGDYERAATLHHESLALLRAMNNKEGIATALYRLGLVAYYQGNYGRAMEWLKESMTLSHELGDRSVLAGSLAGWAWVAAARGQPAKGAWLLGAMASVLEVMGAELPSPNRVEYERRLAHLRDQLDDDQFAAAYAKGRAMTLEQALAEALSLMAEP